MRITWNELTVKFDPQSSEQLLSDWRWLVGEDMKLFLISSLGDMFLADGVGQIHWLDSGAGKITMIAASAEEFRRLMQQRENADQWFIPNLVGDLIASGKMLAAGQCYGYKKPPILGGEIEVGNFEPTDLSVHFSILGQICRQACNLPAGSKINIKLVK